MLSSTHFDFRLSINYNLCREMAAISQTIRSENLRKSIRRSSFCFLFAFEEQRIAIKLEVIYCSTLMICDKCSLFMKINYRNKTQKRVIALNRDIHIPPCDGQFLLDFEQLQSQFPVGF